MKPLGLALLLFAATGRVAAQALTADAEARLGDISR